MKHLSSKFIALLCISLFLFSPSSSNAQSKQSGISEVDRLYKKYETVDKITLHTPFGDLDAKVINTLNEAGKPISVRLEGVSYNEDAVVDFLVNTIKMKQKQGYKRPSTNSLSDMLASNATDPASFWEMVSISSGEQISGRKVLLRKGTMYFLLDAVKSTFYNRSISSSVTECRWFIETGDSKRKGGKSSETFDF